MSQLSIVFNLIFPMISDQEYGQYEYFTTVGPDVSFSIMFNRPFAYYRGGTSDRMESTILGMEEV